MPPSSGKSAPVCSTCNNQRYLRFDVEIGDPRYGKVMPCPDCNKATVDRLSGLNAQERAIRLEDIVTKDRPDTVKMVQAARDFLREPHGFLSIHGNYGNGKTTVIMGIVNALIERGIEARYITAAQLLAYCREAFNDDTKKSDYERLHELAAVPVLCIDELDKLRSTEYAREIQQELLNTRYREAAKVGTVLAWNGELEALDMPAIRSRAQEFTVIRNMDKDLRPLLGGNK